MRQAVSLVFFRRTARRLKTAREPGRGSVNDCNMDVYNMI
jgi:hypothetical protein